MWNTQPVHDPDEWPVSIIRRPLKISHKLDCCILLGSTASHCRRTDRRPDHGQHSDRPVDVGKHERERTSV
jgi:hypothetical protein